MNAAVVIAVPMVLEAISAILNIKKNKLQEYYDTSQAFRDYVTSLTSSLNTDVENELLQVTPSTTPRFDIPWITEELHKKQNEIFNIKQEISKIQTQAYQSAQETFHNSPEQFEGTWKTQQHGLGSFFTNPMGKARDKFDQRKKKESDQYTSQVNDKYKQMEQVAKKPLTNSNPTYQSIQQRRSNAQSTQNQKK